MSKALVTSVSTTFVPDCTSVWFWGNLLTWLESYLRCNIKLLACDFRGPTGSILGSMLFLLFVNSLPDAVRSSHIAAFADDTKIFKEITSTRDAEQLQEDLSNLVT